jgi:hypothetical protein
VKKTHTQFVAVFVGVLILHLVVATVLMNSAQTGGSGLAASLPDPYYHSSPGEPEKSPGWGAAETTEESSVAGDIREIPAPPIPDAFADAGEKAADPAPGEPVEASSEPAPPKPAPAKKVDPAPVSPTRRLTVTELLTPDTLVTPDADAEEDTAAPEPAKVESGPKIKPITQSAPNSNSGPRKIRSLTGN